MGLLVITVVAIYSSLAVGLDNGLARTPPMGWMSWERFRCNTDCQTYPDSCISEKLFRDMADMLVKEGYRDVGYEYVIIDDCWLEHQRGEDGKLVADKTRFPNGISSLSSYIHSQGLKFGIYEDYGNYTCGGYPGVLGHMKTDADTFAEWGVDYVKLDGCYSDPATMIQGYPEFGRYLNETGRPMVYSCSWPAYQIGQHPQYNQIATHCNLWRNFDDIADSWESVLSIIDFYAADQDNFVEIAGPGKWNDPDMLIIGNFGLSIDQAEVQMGMWCVMAAPLIMSNDLRNMRPEYKAILQNRAAIKINQDPLGIQGKRVYKEKDIEIYLKPIMPSYKEKKSAAVSIINRWNEGTPVRVVVPLAKLGLDNLGGYAATDVFSGESLGTVASTESLILDVNPTGIRFIRLDVLPGIFYSWHRPGGRQEEVGVTVRPAGLSGWLSL